MTTQLQLINYYYYYYYYVLRWADNPSNDSNQIYKNNGSGVIEVLIVIARIICRLHYCQDFLRVL